MVAYVTTGNVSTQTRFVCLQFLKHEENQVVPLQHILTHLKVNGVFPIMWMPEMMCHFILI